MDTTENLDSAIRELLDEWAEAGIAPGRFEEVWQERGPVVAVGKYVVENAAGFDHVAEQLGPEKTLEHLTQRFPEPFYEGVRERAAEKLAAASASAASSFSG